MEPIASWLKKKIQEEEQSGAEDDKKNEKLNRRGRVVQACRGERKEEKQKVEEGE